MSQSNNEYLLFTQLQLTVSTQIHTVKTKLHRILQLPVKMDLVFFCTKRYYHLFIPATTGGLVGLSRTASDNRFPIVVVDMFFFTASFHIPRARETE